MRLLTMQYPGDPPVQCLDMSMQEFLVRYPRTPMRICSATAIKEIPMPANLVICDCCNAELKPDDRVMLVGGTRGYCPQCATQNVLPHCT